MTTTTYYPAVANLEHWCDFDWSQGLQVEALDPLETLEVQTKNTTYQISVMDARRGQILVRGGQFFPVFTDARLSGASLAGSFLKVGGIYIGLCMEFHTKDGPIVTTRVRKITVFRSHTPPS